MLPPSDMLLGQDPAHHFLSVRRRRIRTLQARPIHDVRVYRAYARSSVLRVQWVRRHAQDPDTSNIVFRKAMPLMIAL